MANWHFITKTFLAVAITAAFAACNAATTQTRLAPSALPATAPMPMATVRNPDELLYVAVNAPAALYIYSLPALELVAEPSGFTSTILWGSCADKAGDVFVMGWYPSEIIEYQRGGSTPFNTIAVEGAPFSCSVDPESGNLAVANTGFFSSGRGSVLIYPNEGSGKPRSYTVPNEVTPTYLAYDDNGNLFVNGSYISLLAELPRGKSSFKAVTMPSGVETNSMQWNGTYLVIYSCEKGKCSDGVQRFAISNFSATLKGTTITKEQADYFFTLYATQLDTVLIGGRSLGSAFAIAEWKYPAGGAPIKSVILPAGAPAGMAISY